VKQINREVMSIENHFVENDCYFMKGKRRDRQVTNFILTDPKHKYGDAKAGDIMRMVSCTVYIQQNGARVCPVHIPEGA
jgi:hypothetical protein